MPFFTQILFALCIFNLSIHLMSYTNVVKSLNDNENHFHEKNQILDEINKFFIVKNQI